MSGAHNLRKHLGRTACVPVCLMIFAGISFSNPQQGEFVPQKSPINPHMAEVLQHPVAVLAAATVQVPEVIGHKLQEAESILRASKLSMGDPQFVPSKEAPGTVVRQYPQPRATVRVPTSVLVWVSQEQQVNPAKLVAVPSLIQHRADDAVEMLKLVGLQVSFAGIREVPSEEETGIVLSQEPPARTLVSPGSSVSITVSRHIERKLELRVFPWNVAPGESVALTAELNPPFPGAQYQFSFGSGIPPTAWSPDRQVHFTYLNDGDYEPVVIARWDNESVESNRVRIVVHSVKYEIQLLPASLHVRRGESVAFRAEVSPSVKTATYIFHFGDDSQDQTSAGPAVRHVYQATGNYSARVTARIADARGPGETFHAHDFPSRPVQLSVENGSINVLIYVIGTAVLVAAASYGIWRILTRVQILVHKDLGSQSVQMTSRIPVGLGAEIVAVRSWGEQSITSQGPICARLETLYE